MVRLMWKAVATKEEEEEEEEEGNHTRKHEFHMYISVPVTVDTCIVSRLHE